MKNLLCALFAVAGLSLAVSESDAGILFNRGGGMGMVCNVQQAGPVQASAQNLTQVAAARVLAPMAASAAPVQLAKGRSGVSLKALAALKTAPASAFDGSATLVATK